MYQLNFARIIFKYVKLNPSIDINAKIRMFIFERDETVKFLLKTGKENT